jgi:anthranilate synthase component I
MAGAPDDADFTRRYEAGAPSLAALTLVADLETPVAAFLKLRARHAGPAFLLESVEGGAVRGRYSMIGLDPGSSQTTARRSRVCGP